MMYVVLILVASALIVGAGLLVGPPGKGTARAGSTRA